MTRSVKREPLQSTRSGRRKAGGGGGDSADELRAVKQEQVCGERNDSDEVESTQDSQQEVTKRRVLRSQYLAVIHEISEARDDLSKVDSKMFNVIINEVDKLHTQVQKPREQVADAEALHDIASTLMTSIKSQSNEGVTPSDFISCLLREFALPNSGTNDPVSLNWKDIGIDVSPIFSKGNGCCTMLGPMSTQLKQRKTAGPRRRERPTESARPEELADSGAEERTDTDKNMSTMFEILRRNKRVKLESLILNRRSFSQTVENLFALSFLVKDGRTEISIDKNGSHFVSPRNAPAANAITSREVTYSHFVFRFDFKDWRMMVDLVPNGEELMPHRESPNSEPPHQAETNEAPDVSHGASIATPIRKLSRNRCLVIQDEITVEDSPDNQTKEVTAMFRCKRKLNRE